jgi:hypothetical protein
VVNRTRSGQGRGMEGQAGVGTTPERRALRGQNSLYDGNGRALGRLRDLGMGK